MGAIASLARKSAARPLNHYNVEERAMKVISRDKPTPAPPHPSMRKVMDEIMKDPAKLKSSRTDPRLLKNLTQVYITSDGENPTIRAKTLPQEREAPPELTYGYDEPKVVPPGKASLPQILEFVANHSKEPEVYTVEKIAKDYNLDIVDVMNVLQYTKTLLIHAPKPKPKEIEPNRLRRVQNVIDNLKK